jgi:uncharacterized radical SAM protein YgiQ
MGSFLPISKEDMAERGWEQLDFVFISGDSYVDHPSFGPAIISRLLEKHGYKVGIIAQPNWRDLNEFNVLGRPRLGVLISSGNMDSMLNKFTAAKKTRHQDNYTAGGKLNKRPERATTVYANCVRKLWSDVPIIIGGIEASLRRFAHYDYWSDSVRRSVLLDSAADLLIYGMGEKQIIEIAYQLNQGYDVAAINDVAGTCYKVPSRDYVWDYVEVPSFEVVRRDKKKFAESFRVQYLEQDPFCGKRILQCSEDGCVVQNPPAKPLTTVEMDEIYDLPYMRTYHPIYEPLGGVPAIDEVKFSLVSQRGCFGGCNFCAIVSHQGRIIQSRSHESLLREAKILTEQKDFKGYIHDVGGPTANFRHASCQKQLTKGTCRGKQCLFPEPCKNIDADHSDYIKLLKELRALPKVKKVFIRSGIRYDYLLKSPQYKEFLRELCAHHVSGQLKIAPEHIAKNAVRLMGKSDKSVYMRFAADFAAMNEKLGKKQYLVPYFMSSHPGATLKDAIELAEFIRDLGYRPEQVQDFIPTPGSLSTCMYYSSINPLTGESVFVAKSAEEKKMQRALLQYRDAENYAIVKKALLKAGRADLIGYGKKCLLRPSEEKAPRKGRKKADFIKKAKR